MGRFPPNESNIIVLRFYRTGLVVVKRRFVLSWTLNRPQTKPVVFLRPLLSSITDASSFVHIFGTKKTGSLHPGTQGNWVSLLHVKFFGMRKDCYTRFPSTQRPGCLYFRSYGWKGLYFDIAMYEGGKFFGIREVGILPIIICTGFTGTTVQAQGWPEHTGRSTNSFISNWITSSGPCNPHGVKQGELETKSYSADQEWLAGTKCNKPGTKRHRENLSLCCQKVKRATSFPPSFHQCKFVASFLPVNLRRDGYWGYTGSKQGVMCPKIDERSGSKQQADRKQTCGKVDGIWREFGAIPEVVPRVLRTLQRISDT